MNFHPCRLLAATAASALVVLTAADAARAAPCVSGTPLYDLAAGTGFGAGNVCTFGPLTYTFSTDVVELALEHLGGPAPVLDFHMSGNVQTLTWNRLNFRGAPSVGTAFGYSYVETSPYQVSAVSQSIVQTPSSPAGIAYSNWNTGRDINGNWIPPVEYIDNGDPYPAFWDVKFLATLNSITHTITLIDKSSPGPSNPTVPAPEPGTLTLLASALGVAASAGRRRNRRGASSPA